jgi:hypothetical protein
MNKTNHAMNKLLRGVRDTPPAEQPTRSAGHGSADGAPGQGQEHRPTTADTMNQAIRDVARGNIGRGQ